MSIPSTHRTTRRDFIQRNSANLKRISPAGEPGPARPSRQAPTRGTEPTRPRRHTGRGVLVAFCLIGLISFIPNVSAEAYQEGFESCDQFDIPDSGGECTNDAYTYTTLGTGSGTVSTTEAHTGTKSYRLATSSPSNIQSYFTTAATGDQIRCDGVTTLLAADWWMKFPALPTADFYEFGVTSLVAAFNEPTANALFFRVNTLGQVTAIMNSDDGTVQVGGVFMNIAVDTWYHFQAGCSVTGSTATLQWFELTEEVFISTTKPTTAWDSPGATVLSRLSFAINTAAGATSFYVDDIEFGDFVVQTPGSVFCSNPFAPDFSYTYVEDVVYDPDTGNVGAGIDDGFIFEGDADDSGYLAKGFDFGGVAMAVNFTLQATGTNVANNADSLFRVAFTTGGGGLPSALIAGNSDGGTDGSSFDNHVGVRLEEQGTPAVWDIQIRQNVGGTGYNPIGANLQFGNPYEATAFRFEVDSRDLTAKLYANGVLLMTRNIDATFADDGEVWFDQWFIGKGIDNILNIDAVTILNDNDGDADSTCIFDLIGGVVAEGDQGTTPHSQVPDVPGGDGDGDGDGGAGGVTGDFLDSPYFWVFIWIVLYNIVVATVSWGTRSGFGGVVYAVGSFAIYIAAVLWYGTDDVSIWPVIILTAFSVAVILLWGFIRR